MRFTVVVNAGSSNKYGGLRGSRWVRSRGLVWGKLFLRIEGRVVMGLQDVVMVHSGSERGERT